MNGGNIMGDAWSDAEVNILLRQGDMPSPQISAQLALYGYKRTPKAVSNKRSELRAGNGRPPSITADRRRTATQAARDAMAGWPLLNGDDDTRDRHFVRRVQSEALRLGIARRA